MSTGTGVEAARASGSESRVSAAIGCVAGEQEEGSSSREETDERRTPTVDPRTASTIAWSRPPSPRVAAVAAAHRQVVLVLVGMPGCGKSTFTRQLAGALGSTASARWTVVSQDTLGSRGACIRALAGALRAGRSAIIDRCNFDASQRDHWIRTTRECVVAARGAMRPPLLVALHIDDADVEMCVDRVMRRKDHPTLPPSEKSAAIVRGFSERLVPARADEGFDVVLSLSAPGGRAGAVAQILAAAAGGPAGGGAPAASVAVDRRPHGGGTRAMCRYFLQGRCTRGAACHFSHGGGGGMRGGGSGGDGEAPAQRAAKGRAFCLVQDTRTHRVLVVQQMSAPKRWMLPGGLIDDELTSNRHGVRGPDGPREAGADVGTAARGAARELQEESGLGGAGEFSVADLRLVRCCPSRVL